MKRLIALLALVPLLAAGGGETVYVCGTSTPASLAYNVTVF